MIPAIMTATIVTPIATHPVTDAIGTAICITDSLETAVKEISIAKQYIGIRKDFLGTTDRESLFLSLAEDLK